MSWQEGGIKVILAMYDEGELNLEELFELWEEYHPAPLVYGSPEYLAHVAGQRAIYEEAIEELEDAGFTLFGLPVKINPDMRTDEIRLESWDGTTAASIVNLGTADA